MSEQCQNCKWWGTSAPDMVTKAPCHRMPPTGRYDTEEHQHEVEWPHTSGHMTCGEWSQRDQKE